MTREEEEEEEKQFLKGGGGVEETEKKGNFLSPQTGCLELGKRICLIELRFVSFKDTLCGSSNLSRNIFFLT